MRWFLLVLICLALPACNDPPEELRIGANRWLGYGPFYLADDLQWFEAGQVRLVEYPNATSVLRAFRNGLLDAALLTLDETLALQASGYDLEIVLVADVSAGADVVYARPPNKHIQDLRGQRVGVENTALGAYILARLMSIAELAPEDMEVVSLPVQEHTEAMRDGRVDAIITFASEGPALIELGARRIFDSRDLPGEIIDVLVVDRERVDRRRRQALRSLWYESLQAWVNTPSLADEALQRRLGLASASLEMTRDGLIFGDRPLNQRLLDNAELLDSLRRVQRYMLQHGLLEDRRDVQALMPACGRASC